MGESLAYSWLRHIKKCQIVQTNWKPSPLWMDNVDSTAMEQMEKLAKKISDYFKKDFKSENEDFVEEYFQYIEEFKDNGVEFKIFKKNANFAQMIKQCECDTMGLSFENGMLFFYAVEIAYHCKGLNYGSKNQTLMKVLSKMSRVAMCAHLYFQVTEGEIVFVSPKVFDNIQEPLQTMLPFLQKLLQEAGLNFKLSLIFNEDCRKILLDPLIEKSNQINDTSELFLRSYQLGQILGLTTTVIPKVVDTNFAESKTRIPKFPEVVDTNFAKAKTRIPKWAKHPEQCNHRIIRAYFKILERDRFVTVDKMREMCNDKNEQAIFIGWQKFQNNYNQMKTDAGNSHGKVFMEDSEGVVTIWSEIKETLMQYKEYFT